MQTELDKIIATGGEVAAYRKTHEFAGDYINQSHRDLAEAALQEQSVKIQHPIRGSLRREDAAKIYELAYFARGTTADIGTNWGLSGAIAGQALLDAGAPFSVQTVDMDPKMRQRAIDGYRANKIVNVVPHASEAAAWLDVQAEFGQKFAFVFVDHSHQYEPVKAVSERLHRVMKCGAYVAFHDFIDKRNANPANPDFAVSQGARDGLNTSFVYSGSAGCTGVFRFIG